MYFKKPSREELLTTLCILIWVILLNIAAILMGLTAWPMFFTSIFFFLEGADTRKLPNIFLGVSVGLLEALALKAGTYALAPALGSHPAVFLVLGILLTITILGGTFCPLLCNNFAFAYLTIATIHFDAISWPAIRGHMAVLWLGGAVLVGGAVCILRLTARAFARRAEENKE